MENERIICFLKKENRKKLSKVLKKKNPGKYLDRKCKAYTIEGGGNLTGLRMIQGIILITWDTFLCVLWGGEGGFQNS